MCMRCKDNKTGGFPLLLGFNKNQWLYCMINIIINTIGPYLDKGPQNKVKLQSHFLNAMMEVEVVTVLRHGWAQSNVNAG